MLRNNRFYILIFSFLFSALLYGWVMTSFQGNVQQIRLTQAYALTAVTFLYLTLLAGPLVYAFPNLPFMEGYKHARRALGVSAFYFAALHASISFFGLLGGFEGLLFLSDRYILNVLLGFSALVILGALALTSFDALIKKMTFHRWKLLQRLVYIAAIFILIHALMLGSHFKTFSEYIPQIFFAALTFLFFLEALRLDAFLQKKYASLPNFGLATTLVIGGILMFYTLSIVSPKAESPFSVHNQHIQLAKDAQQNGLSNNTAKLPGMDGDKTKRYTTSFLHPDSVRPQQSVTLEFQVFDASSGNSVKYFKIVNDKPSHLVIVDSTLTYYSHIHPEPTEKGFSITTKFPKAGEYHLYLNYQPFGAIEQQTAFALKVGESGTVTKSNAVPDTTLTKTFGKYQVTLQHPKPLLANQLSVGQQLITFSFKDSSGNPVTTLKPYLAAFGHLVMINKDTYDYIHVHPNDLTPPTPNENGGPDVTFMPLGLYGPIKPGIYRVFGQFNPNNELFTADFTVEIK